MNEAAQNAHLSVARQEIGSLMDRYLTARADTEVAVGIIKQRDSELKNLNAELDSMKQHCSAISNDLETKVNQIIRANEQKESTRQNLVNVAIKTHLWLTGSDVLPKSVPYQHENEMKTALLADRKAVTSFIQGKSNFERSGLISMVGARSTLPMFKEDSELMGTVEGRMQIVVNCVTLYVDLSSKVLTGTNGASE